MNGSSLWRAISPQAVAWREWDDELVVYNDATGNTHHLAPLGAEVLLALLRNPTGLDMPGLIRLVAGTAQTPEAEIVAAEVERALAELARLELAACNPA